MITKETACSLKLGQTLYHKASRGSDRRPSRCRVNGRCRVWKTRPREFRLPVKWGLTRCFNITEWNGADWALTEEEAMT